MMFDTWSPDVFLSDIEMPGEDGYVLMRKVRAQYRGAQPHDRRSP